ncbi:amino acid adenylation domain-containing protein [Aquimarina sp. D1M17]|uniref:non-ribosomal peptide synthetase n=1 Tax=Aquimarina acroporae TaxID=2937283 RepID=UPI0020BF8E2B|nr:non-ribosomal peptide synthetase [Aquimarina acroporae]MCK8524319.1 amino acid adenylation domain-containing protein [Aquimarina acroporae]
MNNIVELLISNGIKLFVENDEIKLKKKVGHQLSEDILDVIKSNKKELIFFLKNQKTNPFYRTKTVSDFGLPSTISNEKLNNFLELPIHQGKISNLYPLTPLQKGFLYHNLYDNNESAYVCQFYCDLNGEISRDNFEKTWKYLIQKHTVLRTSVFAKGLDVPVQCVYAQVECAISELDYSEVDPANIETKFDSFLKQDLEKGFSLDKAPLFRIHLIDLGNRCTRFVFTHHHIILDGWSVQNLMKDFYNYYVQLESGTPTPKLTLDEFGDHLRHITTFNETEGVSFWSTYLSRLSSSTYLPFVTNDSLRNKRFGNKKVEFTVEGPIQEITKKYRITENTLVQGAWSYLLSKYTTNETVAFGNIISGRNLRHNGIDSKAGLYMNTIPVCSTIDENDKVSDWLQELQKQHTISREEYGYFSLNTIENQSEVKGSLFDTIMSFQNYIDTELSSNVDRPLTMDNLKGDTDTNYTCTLDVYSYQNQLRIVLLYNDELLSDEVVSSIQGHLETLLTSILEETEYVKDLNYLTKEEEKQIVVDFNTTKENFGSDITVLGLFNEHVQQTPDATALIFENEKLTYEELDVLSSRWAKHLLKSGIKQDDVVAIRMTKSIEMFITIFSILKTGAGYMMIDPMLPSSRITHMMEETKSSIIVTNINEKISGLDAYSVINIDQFSKIDDETEALKLPMVSTQNLAYVLYTSGSTGRPKGCMISHANLYNFIAWGNNFYFENKDEGHWALLSSMSFDLSVTVTFTSLTRGKKLFIGNEDKDMDQLLEESFTNPEIDTLMLTPSHVTLLKGLDGKQTYIKTLICGGEQLKKSHLEIIKNIDPNITIFNEYGPTEATVACTATKISIEDKTIPIGRPIANTKIYILDSNQKNVPIGVSGELYIHGAGVSKGYINNEKLSSERFVTINGEYCYRTGDLGRWDKQGQIEYLGRIDNQIKIRGFRIEPGEIESVLENHPNVEEAFVIVQGGDENKQLCAYLKGVDTLETSALKELLLEKLPDYMIPKSYMWLDTFPYTISGKINRKALPKHDLFLDEIVLPENDIQKELVTIYSEILKIEEDKIGITNDFFDLGGNSLNLIYLKNKLEEVFQVSINLKRLVSIKNIEELAKEIEHCTAIHFSRVPKVDKRSYYPLSSGQKRMYFLHQYDKESLAYNIPMVASLRGKVNVTKLELAFQELVQRHESFRTVFETVDGEVVQRILTKNNFSVEHFKQTQKDQIDEILNDFIRPFDLTKSPLLRVGLISISEKEYVIICDTHHIVSDGITSNILLSDFIKLYNEENLEDINIQYKDYAVWQQDERQQEMLLNERNFWLNQFADDVPFTELPIDGARPATINYNGQNLKFSLNETKTKALKRLAQKENTTLFMVLLSVYNVLLSKLCNQEDVIIGTSVSGRPHADLEQIAGMFINTLALRNFPIGTKPFLEFLREVSSRAFDAFEHQNYPYEDLVDSLNLARDTSRHPLVSVMFEYFDLEESNFNSSDFVIEPLDYDAKVSKLDMTLRASEVDDEIELNFQYREDLFNAESIVKFVNYFEKIVDQIIEEPSRELKNFSVLQNSEYELLQTFNDTAITYDQGKSLVALFEEQVDRNPDRIALVSNGERLTYRDLDERSNKIANYLISRGVIPGNIVGLLFDRTADMLTSIWGVLKVGAGYLPLDINLPEGRIRYMLDQSRATFLLTQNVYLEAYSSYLPVEAIHSDSINSQSISRISFETEASDLAYCIFTSGSTGEPKGVMMTHKAVMNLVKGLQERVYSRYEDNYLKVSLLASFSFDASVQQIFGAFLQGHELYVVDEESRKDGVKLLEFYNDNNIDVSDGTPTHLGMLMDASKEGQKITSLSSWILAGEALSKALVNNFYNRFAETTQLYNFYGPTETCVDSTCFKVNRKELDLYDTIPIGKPLPNERAYVTDNYGGLVPVGTIGELCIGGDGLARSYVGQESLTSERFVSNWGGSENKVYRTGDMVRWLPDGNLEYHGRKDNQIKIRGYRIELSEIECQLLNISDIENGIVVVSENEKEKFLVAYYQAKDIIPVARLREFLSTLLPDYMIPSYFVHIKEFPRTITGKIDRRALPKPTITKQENHLEPNTELEKELARIYAEVLDLEVGIIGLNSNFFDLGGHSLKSVFLTNKINKSFNIKVALKDVIASPTIAHLNKLVLSATKKVKHLSIQSCEKREYYPLSPSQQQMFFLHEYNKDSKAYNIPMVVTLRGDVKKTRFEKAFQQLIERHSILRTSFEFVNENPVQRISDTVPFSVVDVVKKETIQDTINDFIRSFDLEKAPLWRVGLLKVSDQEHIMIMDTHHIVSDQVTNEILIKDLISLYKGEILPKPKIQYIDYIMWRLEEEQQTEINKQKDFWLEKFSEEVSKLELPFDYSRPEKSSEKGGKYEFTLNSSKVQQLKNIARSEKVTAYSVILTIYNIFLSKLSNQTDIVVGTPAVGREHDDLQNVTGNFINTLPIRNYLDTKKTFNDFLHQVQEGNAMALENQLFPYEELVGILNVENEADQNGLFNVFLDYRFENEGIDLKDTELEIVEYGTSNTLAKFDLLLSVLDTGNELSFSFTYSKDLFKESTIVRFSKYLKKIIDVVLLDVSKTVQDIDIVSEVEQKKLLVDFNNTEVNYPENETIIDLFKEQVRLYPEEDALIFEGKRLTYRELDSKSDDWALKLMDQGISPGEIIGIRMTRSIDMITAILAILKSGATYLTLDKALPGSRIIHMMEESGCAFIITNIDEQPEVLESYHWLQISELNESTIENTTRKLPEVDLDSLAYILYTSGSTGKPKGCMISHANLYNYISSSNEYYFESFDQGNWALMSSMSFDLSITAIFTSLTRGKKLFLCDEEKSIDQLLLESFNNKEIDTLKLTPTHLTILENLTIENTSVRTIICGGEALKNSHIQIVKNINEDIKVYNEYGPTEATVACTAIEVVLDDEITIGYPMANAKIRILDSDKKLVPIGVSGEIYIGGSGVSNGYINRPELTSEKFVTLDEERFYKSGDLGRWNIDGKIEYLGRIDNQIKIRGHRIEIGEIENILEQHLMIKQAYVTVQGNDENKQLLAYLSGYEQPKDEELKDVLSTLLPSYMIPSSFIWIKAFPYTKNGKIDQKALTNINVEKKETYTAPSNPIEENLVCLWAKILKKEENQIGVESSFIDLGGHSLNVIQLANSINKEFEIQIKLDDIFNGKTIRQLSEMITMKQWLENDSDEKGKREEILL